MDRVKVIIVQVFCMDPWYLILDHPPLTELYVNNEIMMMSVRERARRGVGQAQNITTLDH